MNTQVIEKQALRIAEWAADHGFTNREDIQDWKQIESLITDDLSSGGLPTSAEEVEQCVNYVFDLIEEETISVRYVGATDLSEDEQYASSLVEAEAMSNIED